MSDKYTYDTFKNDCENAIETLIEDASWANEKYENSIRRINRIAVECGLDDTVMTSIFESLANEYEIQE